MLREEIRRLKRKTLERSREEWRSSRLMKGNSISNRPKSKRVCDICAIKLITCPKPQLPLGDGKDF